MRLILHEVRGQQIAARMGGPDPGRPIVFLHGILGSLDVWSPTLPPQIRNGRRWILLSLPGHYPGAWPDGFDSEVNISRMFADALAETIERLVGDRAVELVGWSTGGFAALSLAVHYPERVAGVMSISGFADGHWHGPMGAFQKLAACGRMGRLGCRLILRLVSSHRGLFLRVARRLMCARHFRRNDLVARRTMARLHLALCRHQIPALVDLIQCFPQCNIRPQLSQMRQPALIVGGLHDPLMPASQTKALASAIPGAVLEIVEDVGQFLFLENTRRYWRLLNEWTSRDTAPAVRNRRAGAKLRSA
jgi:pimeloyl-ACP methyl ester carboxylesterase